jgi:hypothetical protein
VDALELLFSSWTGILSIFTVVFAVGFIAYLMTWAWRKSGEGK